MSHVVSIDGPAGSGKSTTAKAVAQALGFAHLDSGALYRAFTLAALDAAVDLAAGERIAAMARDLPIRLDLAGDRFRPEIAGVDVSESVRRADVTRSVSAVSALPAVRERATAMLRAAAALHPRGIVADGRDIGSVVFPHAQLKIFLTASALERAARRMRQESRPGDEVALRAEAEALLARDRADSERAVAPLCRPDGAVPLDTTGMSFQDQVQTIVELARKAFP